MDSQFLVKNLFGIEGLNIAWYAVLICTGIIAGIIVGRYMAKQRGFNFDLIIDFVIIAVPLALICARAYYVIMEWDRYAANPMEIFAVWHGGLAIYGGVIGGLLAVVIFCKWRKFSMGHMIDIGAPALILGQAIGRWGNFVNQEAFGAAVTDKAWQWFPNAVNITKQHFVGVYDEATGKMVQVLCNEPWHQATFFYESVWNLLVFFALLWYQKRAKRRGNVFVMYLVLYGAGRAVIEGMRTDSLWLIPGVVRVSQALSIVLVIRGVVYLAVMHNRPQKPFVYEGKIYDIGYKPEKKKAKKADVEKAANKEEQNLNGEVLKQDANLSNDVKKEETKSTIEEGDKSKANNFDNHLDVNKQEKIEDTMTTNADDESSIGKENTEEP